MTLCTIRLFFVELHRYLGDGGPIYAAATAYAALAALFPLLLILFFRVSPFVQPPTDIEHMMNRFLNIPVIGNSLSRSVSAVFALLTWPYALATVFLFGAEVSATYETPFKGETR